jgi:hypothetical protein
MFHIPYSSILFKLVQVNFFNKYQCWPATLSNFLILAHCIFEFDTPGVGGGELGTEFYLLGSICEEVTNPGAGERVETQGRQFADQDSRDDGVEG